MVVSNFADSPLQKGIEVANGDSVIGDNETRSDR